MNLQKNDSEWLRATCLLLLRCIAVLFSCLCVCEISLSDRLPRQACFRNTFLVVSEVLVTASKNLHFCQLHHQTLRESTTQASTFQQKTPFLCTPTKKMSHKRRFSENLTFFWATFAKRRKHVKQAKIVFEMADSCVVFRSVQKRKHNRNKMNTVLSRTALRFCSFAEFNFNTTAMYNWVKQQRDATDAGQNSHKI